MKKDEGYVLLKSLLSTALILILTAAFYAVLAAAVRQSGHLENHVAEELFFRREAVMERSNSNSEK